MPEARNVPTVRREEAAALRDSHGERPVVIITGSSGFLGRAIARRLKGRYKIVGLDVARPRDPIDEVKTFEIDLSSQESVARAIGDIRRNAGDQIASVVHLAAYFDTTGEDNPKYDAVTVEGTRRLLKELQTLQTKQFIFSSTLLVHAPSPAKGVTINEDAPIEPTWAYPASKAQTEDVILQGRGAVPVVIMRFAGVYDENCRAAFISQQIARIFERLPTAYLFTGDITSGQPYVHIDDLVEAVERTIDRRTTLPDVTTFLIGEEDTLSYEQMQKRIGHLIHGEEWQTFVLPKGVTKLGAIMQEKVLDQETDIKAWMIENSDDHYEIDISRARQLLGWEPRHSLADTLPEIIRRLKSDPTDWYEINKLEPAPVAASEPELEQAAARLRRPREQSEKRVSAEVELQRQATLWAPLTNAAIGLWLVATPFTLGLFDPITASVPPALGHDIAAAEVRNARLGISEIISGFLVTVLALLGMRQRFASLQWMTAAIGIWIMFAPLAFWTTSAGAYTNDMLAGMFIVAFAVIVPPTPGVSYRAHAADDDRPLGWTYSPSSFTQRLPIIGLALVGLFVSRYLAAYQMGHINSLWDPLFGAGDAPVANGSEAVVTSWVSKGFPIADAGVGAFAYALDILAGVIGDRRRWRTMPWMVLLFGLLIIPLGVISVSFIIIQPPLIGALCTLCIVQAAVTVILIPYSIDEVLATCQYLRSATRAGEPFWRTFWRGGPSLSEDQQPGPDLDQPVSAILREFLMGGVNFPWTLVASTVLGAVLMMTPLLVGTQPPLYFSDHIVGCLIILLAVTAMAEVARAMRFVNVALGAWIVLSPFFLVGGIAAGTMLNVAIGLMLIGLSLPRGTRSDANYGSWDRLII